VGIIIPPTPSPLLLPSSDILMVICFSFDLVDVAFFFFFVVVIFTLSSNASRPRPNTSYPGPKFAVEEDAVAVQEEIGEEVEVKVEESDFKVNL
jgi:hypothetical protein